MSYAACPSDVLGKKANSLLLQQGLALLQSVANAAGRVETLKGFPLQKFERTFPNLEPLSRTLSKMYFPNRQEMLLGSARLSHSMLMWDMLKYSLLSMEIAARCGRTHMKPTYGLDALYKELESSSGFTLSLLLKIVQSTRSKNSLHVLQRFRGIQSFAESICSAVSVDRGGHTSEGTVVKFSLASCCMFDFIHCFKSCCALFFFFFSLALHLECFLYIFLVWIYMQHVTTSACS